MLSKSKTLSASALFVVLVTQAWAASSGAAQAPPGTETVMRDPIPAPVEKGDLAPVLSSDGSGLPLELWRGLDLAGLETIISELEIPPRSPALHSLWKRLMTSDANPPAGDTTHSKFVALRQEALYRSGLITDAARVFETQGAATGPVTTALAARNAFANGDPAKGCGMLQNAIGLKGVPERIKGEVILMTGYCAAASGDVAAAGLAAELAREEGVTASPGLETLDALSIKAKPKLAPAQTYSVIDYRLMDLAGSGGELPADKAELALLVAISNDANAKPTLRLTAAEAAARLNALSPDYLAALYASGPAPQNTEALLAGSQTSTAQRRAEFFKAAETEKAPTKKTRLIRALLDDAKRSGLAFQVMQILGRAANTINPSPETAWFAETAAEIGLASGDYALARKWLANAGSGTSAAQPAQGLDHWLALTDIADPAEPRRGQYMQALEATSAEGRFAPDALHRLATVLDALGYNVPIPLWEAASRTAQPNTGYLPDTGVLTALQDAAKKKEFGRIVLLVMKSIGPNGAEDAHMIALGDAIRALKRAGLEADARRLALEALIGSWPRATVN